MAGAQPRKSGFDGPIFQGDLPPGFVSVATDPPEVSDECTYINCCLRGADVTDNSLEHKDEIGGLSDIAEAMKILIDKSKNFIYIENQFFVSAK